MWTEWRAGSALTGLLLMINGTRRKVLSLGTGIDYRHVERPDFEA
jgi:hypothetical protein